MTRVLACFLGCGLLVLLAAALVPQSPPPRPPPPDALTAASWLSPRVDRFADSYVKARRVEVAQKRLLLARDPRERRAAARHLIAAWEGAGR